MYTYTSVYYIGAGEFRRLQIAAIFRLKSQKIVTLTFCPSVPNICVTYVARKKQT